MLRRIRLGTPVHLPFRSETGGPAALHRAVYPTGRGWCPVGTGQIGLELFTQIPSRCPRRKIDIVIARAQVWPRESNQSTSGHETYLIPPSSIARPEDS